MASIDIQFSRYGPSLVYSVCYNVWFARRQNVFFVEVPWVEVTENAGVWKTVIFLCKCVIARIQASAAKERMTEMANHRHVKAIAALAGWVYT